MQTQVQQEKRAASCICKMLLSLLFPLLRGPVDVLTLPHSPVSSWTLIGLFLGAALSTLNKMDTDWGTAVDMLGGGWTTQYDANWLAAVSSNTTELLSLMQKMELVEAVLGKAKSFMSAKHSEYRHVFKWLMDNNGFYWGLLSSLLYSPLTHVVSLYHL